MHPEESVTHSPTENSATESAGVVVALLGEICTRRDGLLVPLPGARARSLLVALANVPGRSRTAQSLIDEVWGEEPPRAPMNALHTQVSRLRAALPDGAVEVGPAGYRFTLGKAQVDITLARQLEQRAQQRHAEGDHRGALEAVATARSLWRGDPGADLPDGSLARELSAEAAAREAAIDAVELAALASLGDYKSAEVRARAIADRTPLDEPAHLDLMKILVALGRDNDALDVFAGLRARLVDELGADPGRAIIDFNTAILRGDAAAPIRPDAAPAMPNAIGLRVGPNVLLGRADDVLAIEELMTTSRVTTVVGPGGAGKTRMAHELGARAAQHVPVVLVELAALRSGEDIIASISGTLGLSEADATPGGFHRARLYEPRHRLREVLSSKRILLILDNCEHLIDDVSALVADLVGAGELLTVLATSRSPMMIGAEATYPLPPLEIDEHGSPATELFRARARAVRSSARLYPVEVAKLCHTLDGLPLAIELAAARVRSMTVEEINTRLSDRFALLRIGDRNSPERHRTLHAVIDWSWNLLGDQQRAAMRRLCRLPAGFNHSTAEAVAQWGAVDDITDALDGLVNQSMLTVVEHDEPVGLRYHMLETVREYGEEQLAAAGETDELMARISQWAQEFSRRQLDAVLVHRQVDAALSVEAEHDNLLAVLRFATQQRDAVTVYFVFAVLGFHWAARGAHSEVFNWAPRILDIDPRGPDEARIPTDLLIASYLLAGLHRAFTGEIRPIALVRSRIRVLLRERTDLTPAFELQTSLVLGPSSGKGIARKLAYAARSADEWTRSGALSLRANYYENAGDTFGSMRDAKEGLLIARRRDDTWGRSMLCQHLGSLHGQSAEYEQSIAYYREAAQALAELHAYEEGAQSRSFMAASMVGAGRIAEARRELADLAGANYDSGALWTELGEGNGRQAALHASTAEADLAEGDIDSGLARYRQALKVVNWPITRATPGPYEALVASAVVDAHVVHGHADEVGPLVDQLIAVALERLGDFFDRPQIGCVAAAVGSFSIATGRDPVRGAALLALAVRNRGRQDYPSMKLATHLDAARSVLGAECVDRELARTAKLPKLVASAEILEHLRTVRESYPQGGKTRAQGR